VGAPWKPGRGLTHFDTADAYGGGRSETTIGRWCSSRGVRPQITTKTYNPMDEGHDHGLAPARIERQIESSLERLGMDRVDLYLAHDPNTNRLVALKVIKATLDSTEVRQRFAREVRALAALNHPNIVNAYDTGEFEGSPFIVMEYVRGETLAEMIRRRAPMSVPQKLKLMQELCAGLARAHQAGIIHRDIKPANLMVDEQGRLKILDFGIARVVEASSSRTIAGTGRRACSRRRIRRSRKNGRKCARTPALAAPPGRPQPQRHRRIEMPARDRTQGIGAGENRQAKGERHAQKANAEVRKAGGKHGAAAAAEHKPKRSDEFRGNLASNVH